MTMPFEVKATLPVGMTETAFEQVILETFQEINLIYNKWNPDSEISLFNRHRSLETYPVSLKLRSLIEKTSLAYQLTGKRFDPTIEPLQRRWKKAFLEGKLPSSENLEEIGSLIGWDKVLLTSDGVQKLYPSLEVDLGGIAKGYGVDLLFTRLLKEGCSHIYVEWGGEIRVSSHHPEGRPWQVAIKESEGGIRKVVSLSNKALATSGDYFQYWPFPNSDKPERLFFHVFNPCTLSPLEMKSGSVASITVIASSCWLADAVATAGMFLTSEREAEDWLQQLKQVDPSLSFDIEWRVLP